MNTQKVEQEIVESIHEWLKQHKNLVVGIDGYSGAGKTTLLKSLAKKYDCIQPLFMDDFVSTANTKESLVLQIESNSSDLKLDWKPVDGLEKLRKLIREFKLEQCNKVLIVEGIFLCHENVLRNELDKIIYLDTDKEAADTRRVAREKKDGATNIFQKTALIHLQDFLKLLFISMKSYINQQKKQI